MSTVAKLSYETETFVCRFDGFEGLDAVKGASIYASPEFLCFGHQWKLYVYPGGNTNSDDGKVAVYLAQRSEGGVEVEASFYVKQTQEIVAAYHHALVRMERNRWLGVRNFADRSTILGSLEDGALVIEVQLGRKLPSGSASLAPSPPFVPANPFCQNALKKFLDEESADVVFEVSSDKKKSGALKENVQDIIDAADRFGVVGLKLEAEAAFVSSTDITTDNVMDNLLYGYAKNLALLQEAVMDFVVENVDETAKKLSLQDVPGSFVSDFMLAMNRGKKEGEASNVGTERVSDLRRMLHEKGLDVDGSREAMIDRLKEPDSE